MEEGEASDRVGEGLHADRAGGTPAGGSGGRRGRRPSCEGGVGWEFGTRNMQGTVV